MKRIAIIFFAILTLFSNAYETVEDGQFRYGHQRLPNSYFPINYTWDGNPANMDIYIPETYNGKRITKVGGAIGRGAPAPFIIDMPKEYDIPNEDDRAFCTDEEACVTDTEYDVYTFTIHIGPYVKEYTDETSACGESGVFYGREDENCRQDIFYKVEYTYEIDDSNPYLTVVDGTVCQAE